jgi:hypothetical protein
MFKPIEIESIKNIDTDWETFCIKGSQTKCQGSKNSKKVVDLMRIAEELKRE